MHRITHWRRLVAITAAVIAAGGPAAAQDYPSKPVRIVLGFGAGGSTDVGARIIAREMSKDLGQPVVVENRTGAGGAIANERVATSPPDGYTLLMMSASATILPALRKLPYDVERDLAPLSLVAAGPLVLVVHPSVPAGSVKELVALARARPDTLNYASSGAGSTAHLAGELLQAVGKFKLLHVPYKSTSDAVTAAAGGNVDMNFPSVPAARSLVDAKKVRALAVTSLKRAALLPTVPTIDESGLRGYEYGTWFGMMAPAKVPAPIIERLHSVIVKIVAVPHVREAFLNQGLEPQSTTPAEFAAYIRRELEKNARLIRAAGMGGR